MKQVVVLFFLSFLILGAMTHGCATTRTEVREISVHVMAPDMGWKIEIQDIYRVGNELWVVSALERSPGMAAQMPAAVSDSLSISVPDLPIKVFVLGKTWKWENTEPYVFVENGEELKTKLKKGERIYTKSGN